ncbi:gliding motility-associated ABC transporter permease subunit GldF [Robertkochia flava]|uniref:gliding motility-associated ABC transporter permease subunit GldF n=1 Tax=Robertkochia flava TaxID=3447986 RepID=UPI001CCE2684|nr:gliding motility-associated ABC transporter permease subunit GldF [Robertkochia marina]
MLAILKREISNFFTSPIAYLVMGLFLVITGLFLWVFKGPFNIPDSGFADLTPFFELAPWVFVFLIPAITMKSFADERQLGTLEMLLTKPISIYELVTGKFLGGLLLVVCTLIPTLLYVYTLYTLGNPTGNLDMGSIIGSYLGLLFLASGFVAVGVFASSVSTNQITAFILAVVLCFGLLYLPQAVSELSPALSAVEGLGIKAHFDSISRGVLSLADLTYFISLSVLFIVLTATFLKK